MVGGKQPKRYRQQSAKPAQQGSSIRRRIVVMPNLELTVSIKNVDKRLISRFLKFIIHSIEIGLWEAKSKNAIFSSVVVLRSCTQSFICGATSTELDKKRRALVPGAQPQQVHAVIWLIRLWIPNAQVPCSFGEAICGSGIWVGRQGQGFCARHRNGKEENILSVPGAVLVKRNENKGKQCLENPRLSAEN
jgi:hypothetical protein